MSPSHSGTMKGDLLTPTQKNPHRGLLVGFRRRKEQLEAGLPFDPSQLTFILLFTHTHRHTGCTCSNAQLSMFCFCLKGILSNQNPVSVLHSLKFRWCLCSLSSLESSSPTNTLDLIIPSPLHDYVLACILRNETKLKHH